MSLEYEAFVNKNLFNYGIISLYCDELTENPYEDNLATDLVLGKWLDEIIQALNSELIPLICDVIKFKIDISILDIYRNLMILVGKRFELLSGMAVVFILTKGLFSSGRI